MIKKIICTLFIFLLSAPVLFSQIENPVVFDVDDTDSLLHAEFNFTPLPEYNRECSLTVTLVSKSEEVNTHAFKSPNIKREGRQFIRKDIFIEGKELDFNLKVGPQRYVETQDTVLSWVPPIEVEDSFTATIPVKFTGVGQYTLQLIEMDNSQDIIKMLVSIVLDDEGKLVYLGKFPPPTSYPLGAHHYVFDKKIQSRVEGRATKSRMHQKSWPEPFDIDMTFSPTPKVGERSRVDLTIAPYIPGVTDMQYEIIGATNLLIDSLSPSPGPMPAEIENFEVSFQMMPKSSGRSYVSFEIFGYRPEAERTKMPFSRIDYHMIFGSDSSLLYMGEVDPFAVGFETDNPAYKAIDEIMDFSQTGYGEKVYRSEPDYEHERIREQFVRDSIEASRMQDTLETEDEE